jgi:hypothetical protein
MACSDKPQVLIKRTNGTFLVEPVEQDAWANLEQDQIVPEPIQAQNAGPPERPDAVLVLTARGAEVHSAPAPLSPRERADVAEAWAVLGRAGGCGVAPAPESREQLQGALRDLWAENERRRKVFS